MPPSARLTTSLVFDETYYLHRPENEHDYSQEAIKVLLQVMESERQNLVILMAGYESPIEEFFQANPRIGSRVAHHIRFPDYNVDELLQIAQLMVDKQGYEMNEDGERALRDYIELLKPPLDIVAQRTLTVLAHLVALLVDHQLGDLEQLVHVIVGEADMMDHPRAHPRIGLKELLHRALIAGHQNHQVLAL